MRFSCDLLNYNVAFEMLVSEWLLLSRELSSHAPKTCRVHDSNLGVVYNGMEQKPSGARYT